MDNDSYIRKAICYLFLVALIARNHAAVVDVKTKGAKGDGVTDDGPVHVNEIYAIVSAWKEACGGASPSSLVFPPGNYLTGCIEMKGPCKAPIEIRATGATIKAPPELAKFKIDSWIYIKKIDDLTMTGGIFDGQGQQTWHTTRCHDSQMSCQLPVNLRLRHLKNALIKDIISVNSKNFHLALWGVSGNLVNITINAPQNSSNTDGIHIARSDGLNITNSNIKTGDDCISFGDGSKNVHIDKVTCGPGHGFSIGSLGKYPNEEPVQGIFFKNCTLTGTDNGLRIKSWPASHPGTATDVHFEDIIMNKVSNPILIDQEYCPHTACQKSAPSKVKLSNVSFRKIKGISNTKLAVKFLCSAAAPCENVEVADINLSFHGGGTATSHCSNVKPKVTSQVVPPACTSGPK